MYLGTSLILIAVGLILALAVEFEVSGIDINMIGWILFVVGIIGALLELAVFRPRRTTTTVAPGVAREREIVRDRDVY